MNQFQRTCKGRIGIMWLALRRQQTISKYPYNFIAAIQNKIKLIIKNSKAFSSRGRKENRDYKEYSNLLKGRFPRHANKSNKKTTCKLIKEGNHKSEYIKYYYAGKVIFGTTSSETKTLNQKVLNKKFLRHTKVKRSVRFLTTNPV